MNFIVVCNKFGLKACIIQIYHVHYKFRRWFFFGDAQKETQKEKLHEIANGCAKKKKRNKS